MSDMPSAAPDAEAAQIGIPLDLAPLLTPYGHYQRLSVRVVQLPPLVCLSKGTANEDRSWSLTPADLDGLELLLPEEASAPIALAVRIVGIDKNENATIIGQFDVPLFAISPAATAAAKEASVTPPAAAPTDWQGRIERRVAAALRLGERRAAQALAEAEAQWEVESERRLAEQVERLDQGWQRKLRAERAAHGDAEAKAADAAQQLAELSEDLKAERAARGAVETRVDETEEKLTEVSAELEAARTGSAAAEAQWIAERDARVAAAVQQAVRDAEATAEARLEEARALWQQESRRQIDAIKQEHGQAAVPPEGSETSLVEAEERWEAESARRLAEQAERLEADWQQRVASERAARDEAEAEAAEARQKLAGLSDKLAAARARAAEAEAAAAGQGDDGRRAAEAAEARMSQELARLVAVERARCEAQSEKDIAAAVRKAEALAKARLQDAREAWENETQAAVAAAEVKLRSDYAKQFAMARAEWQKEALAAAGKGRRKLRSVAQKQSLGNAGRAVLRLGLVAGCLAAGVFLYTEFKPAIMSQWVPKGLELVGGIESAARAQLESLSQTPQQRMAVAAEVANLRDGPSTAREVLTTLPRNTVVSVLERRGDWVRVETGDDDSRQGWLHHSLLETDR